MTTDATTARDRIRTHLVGATAVLVGVAAALAAAAPSAARAAAAVSSPLSSVAPSTPPAATRLSSGRTGEPAISIQLRRGEWDMTGPVTFDYQLPQLTGAPKWIHKRFTRAVDAVVETARTDIADFRAQGSCESPGTFYGSAPAGIYQARYASVVMNFDLYACGTADVSGQWHYPAGVTLDLRTGELVSPTRFVSNVFKLRATAVKQSLYDTYDGGCDTGEQLMAPLPSGAAWRVASGGLYAYFPRSTVGPVECGIMTAHVPWRLLATPAAAQGKKKLAYYAYNGSDYCGQKYCGIMAVRARGKVVYIDGAETGHFGWVGVRHDQGGHFFTLGDGVGDVEKLRFAGRSMVAKPDTFGDDWVRISKAEKDQYWPDWPKATP